MDTVQVIRVIMTVIDSIHMKAGTIKI